MKISTRKIVSAVVAVALVVTIALTGTYAWQSISQRALNETMKEVNPGGRLHDDFDGTNKDIYVENYTDPDKGGVPIFARIRLDEYMEIGPEAGKNMNADNRDVTPLVADAKINDPSTWTTHLPDPSVAVCEGGDNEDFHSYWSWTMGGQTVYMPTFNKDNTSLKADINGTYVGNDGSYATGTPYDDYQDWQLGDTDTDDEQYANGRIETNVTHEAAETQDAQVITMAQWYELGCPVDQPLWVYDVDGWAYWAMPIEPGTATGLLLSEINVHKETDDNNYYAINVVAQFATRGDWGDPELGTGFYTDDEDPSPEALYLLNKAADRLPSITVSGDNKADVTDTVALTAKSSPVANAPISWSVENNSSDQTVISEDGKLYIGQDEPTGTIIVRASTEEMGGVEATHEIQVYRPELSINYPENSRDNGDNVAKGMTRQFELTVSGGKQSSADYKVTWDVEDEAEDGSTVIDRNGLLSIDFDEVLDSKLTITATLKNGLTAVRK